MEQAGSKAVGLLVQIILARMLTPEDFGILAIMLVIVNIADSISQSGLGLALIQANEADDDSYSTALWLSLSVATIFYILIFIIAPIAGDFYDVSQMPVYLRVIGIIIFFNAINSIQRSYLQKRMAFKKLCIASLGGIIVSGAIGIICAVEGAGIWSLVIQSLLQSVMICLIMVLVIPWRPKFYFSKKEAVSLYSYGWKICVTGILGVFYTGISELIIGKTCDPVNLGYYSQGRKYPLAASGVISNAISNVMFPDLASKQNNMDAFKTGLKKALSVGTFVVTPMSFLLALIAEPLIALFLTEKWLPCLLIFQLTCIPNAFLVFQLVNLRAYMALGNSGLYLKLQFIKTVLGGIIICGTAALTADVFSTAFAACVVGIFSILVVDMLPAKKEIGYSALNQLKDQMPVFFATAIATLTASGLFLFHFDYLILLILQIVVFSGVYLFTASIFRATGLQLLKSQLLHR